MDISRRRKRWIRYWRVVNPGGRRLAGTLPFWVLLETKGRRSGRRSVTPLAAGPGDSTEMWLIAVHGRHADWVRNIESEPVVRLRHRGTWREGTASIEPMDAGKVAEFNRYARTGPRVAGVDPVLVKIRFR